MPDHVQPLEQRRLLTIPVSGSTLNLTDTPDVSYITAGNDFIEVRLNGSTLEVRNGSGTLLDSRPAAGITGININVGAGVDVVRMGTASGAFVPNLPVTIHGGAGNDSLTGGIKNDQLFGDGDNDRLDGRAGKDLMDGGGGFDALDYSYRTVPVTVTLANSSTANDGSTTGDNSSPAKSNDNGGDNAVDVEAVIGGVAADKLTGSVAGNWMDGGGGNDSIFGGDGIDTLIGGVNSDLAYGEGDPDFFFFQDSTTDKFLGAPGSTTAQFDSNLDTAAPPLASARSVSILAAAREDAPPVDTQFGPKDTQAFNFQFEDETLGPQPMPDYMVARLKALKPGGTFDIPGSPYSDVIKISEADGIITASINGFLWQQTAVDVTGIFVHVVDGNDQVIVDGSVHVGVTVDGGAGNDTVVGSRHDDGFIGGAGNDLFFGLEGNDAATGGDGNDVLLGGAGADSLDGGDGSDILIGGRGKDRLEGGTGPNIVFDSFTLFDHSANFVDLLFPPPAATSLTADLTKLARRNDYFGI